MTISSQTMSLVVPLLVFLVTVQAGYIFRRILFHRLQKITARTTTQIDDIIIAATKGPFIIWCVMLGVFFALKASQLHHEGVAVANKVLMVLGIFSVTLVVAQIVSGLIKSYASRFSTTLATTSLPQYVARTVVIIIGLLVILNSLGISIAPILATLGVGGLAVALALQETLSNLFAGFHILAMRQIKVGDYIKLESGQEGYVTDINWRTTCIRALPNNTVLVPNSKLAQSVVVNYHLPSKDLGIGVDVTVHFNSDLEKVERVCIETAQEVMKQVNGGVPAAEPAVRYQGFGESGINLTVGMKAREFTDQYLVRHEFIKRLHKRFQKEGIGIGYPIRLVKQVDGSL